MNLHCEKSVSKTDRRNPAKQLNFTADDNTLSVKNFLSSCAVTSGLEQFRYIGF